MSKKKWIKNFNELALTKERGHALSILESGLDAIDTTSAIRNSIKLNGDTLYVLGNEVDLSKFKRIKVVGFGKASAVAALALEEILGDKISEGVIVSIEEKDCKHVETFKGTHPRPSEQNAVASKKIYEIAEDAREDDLVIALVSGGGSALLCYPHSECVQGRDLYDRFLKSGKTVIEMNTVRKHLSMIKGGGLAKIAYPATVLGLIFSDIPGDHYDKVASGPTYLDKTTLEEAKKIVEKYDLGDLDLNETPKDEKYFEKVKNFVLVSNEKAVDAMSKKAEDLGYEVSVLSDELYDKVEDSIDKIFDLKDRGKVVLAAGEPKLEVSKKGGKGGRNLYMGLKSIDKKEFKDGLVFIPFASDGLDNSDVAGVVVDSYTIETIEKSCIDVEEELEKFDAYTTFENTGNMIITGATGANVSDLMILLNKK